jgi:hypothetical protein
MANKYLRHQSVISKSSDESGDHWSNEFEKNLQKGAVQSRTQDNSLFDQINSIMNGKSKYPSVAAAVEDMKERSGLTAYLDNMSKVSEKETSNKKTASDKSDDKTPIVFKKCPAAHETLKNLIRDSKGNLSLPAILNRLRSIHKKDVSNDSDWDENNLMECASKLNLQAKQDNPGNFENYHNLGNNDSAMLDSEVDSSNNDFFQALTPVKN